MGWEHVGFPGAQRGYSPEESLDPNFSRPQQGLAELPMMHAGHREDDRGALGLLAVLSALSPALELAAERSFAWHMVQHQVLLLAAAPLIAVSAPVRRLLLGVTGGRRRLGGPRGDAGLWALIAGAVAVGVLLVWHLPPVYDAATADLR